MNRRAFMSLIGGATAWPLAARAQQPGRLIRIGFLTLNSGPTPNTDGFQHGLRQLGYVEGQNLVLLCPIVSMGRGTERSAGRFGK